ncbi:acyl-CoA thioesterase [Sedimentitalea nanhaiensis]|uniref:4-hydroxybenzoyl-CoA thioesterase n=1 Tax=Sedimentitalea nanhaiensis TaxID=999627 RepID=A0A1I7DDG3_9RHOB|nr:thioesterase family protein [Sedimentitalea nanhaiensis]SFU09729.1 4-hydroxybenzoyl-CoA thioesterase [Sedimentitalea nanhaiensis]
MSYVFPQKILFKHCDPAGIVFYPRYFEIINDCVEAFFDDVVGLPFEQLHGYGGVPTAEIRTTFKAPSRHGDRIVLVLDCLKVGRSSLDLSIVASQGDEVRFISHSTLVLVNDEGRPTHWPDTVKAKLIQQMKGAE